jgi:hypothetical protein
MKPVRFGLKVSEVIKVSFLNEFRNPIVNVGSEVYEATLKHLQEVPFDFGVFRLENYEFLHTLD